MTTCLRLAAPAALMTLSLLTAAPAFAVTFTSADYGTAASASAQGMADSDADSGGAVALPLFSTATAAGLQDFATAAATASEGLLSAVASVDSLGAAASAQAEARFVGTLADSGRLRFSFELASDGTLGGGGAGGSAGGTAAGLLSVLLTSTLGNTTSTLLSTSFSATGHHVFDFDLAAGSSTALDIRLAGNAATSALGQSAAQFSQLSFSVTAVPEPASWLMLAAGMAGLGWARSRRQSGRWSKTAPVVRR